MNIDAHFERFDVTIGLIFSSSKEIKCDGTKMTVEKTAEIIRQLQIATAAMMAIQRRILKNKSSQPS